MSARASTASPRACSGAMYSTVPTTAAPTVIVNPDAPVVERAMPKSMISAWPSPSTMMLAGFRSRCTTPASCAAARPDATSLAKRERAIDRQPAVALQDRREVRSLHVRHRDVRDAVDLAEVVNADDVLVRDLAGEQELALEAALELAGRFRVLERSGRITLTATATSSAWSQAW